MEEAQSAHEPAVFITDNNDGSAKVTIRWHDENHRFSIYQEDDTAVVSYEETLSWRGQIRVSEPDDKVFKALMISEEVTEWLDNESLPKIRRER